MHKNKEHMNRGLQSIFAMLLALVMVLSLPLNAFGVQTADEKNGTELTLTPMDPAELGVKKLGDQDAAEPEELELQYGPNDTVRVSIVLKAPSTVDRGYALQNIADNTDAMAYRQTLRRQQDNVVSAIETRLGKSLDVKYHLTLLVNIISAEVKYKDIPLIGMVEGVDHVSPVRWYQPETAVENELHSAITTGNMIGDGTYTKLDCTATESGEHSFTVTVTDADVTIVVALRGDANLDGKVSTPDATMVKQAYLGTAFAIDPNLQALTADASKDGKISTVDATFIKQAYLGSYTIKW